jgi:hypothetical protein
MSFNDELDGLLNNYDAKQDAHKQQMQTKQSQASQFTAEFSNFSKMTAYPIFEQVGNHLRGRGHDFKIEAQDDEPHRNEPYQQGGGHPARIELRIYPKGKESAARDSLPAFRFICSKDERKVRIHVSTMMPGKGGHAGDQGKYSIEQLTPQTIQAELMKFFKEIFAE